MNTPPIYTHICRSRNAAGSLVTTHHESESQALLEQSFRREFAMHTNVVVMPAELPGDSYPTPDSDTATLALAGLHHARKVGAR